MKRILFLLLLVSATALYAQEAIRFGDRSVYLEKNVIAATRGYKTSSLDLGLPTGDRLNVLVQFENEPPSDELLASKGIVLGDYLGSNAYYATVAPGSRPSDFIGTTMSTIVPIRGEWKVVGGLLNKDYPEWVLQGNNLRMSLSWFPTVKWKTVSEYLEVNNVTYTDYSEFLRTAEILATPEQLLALAELECIQFINWSRPPQELNNQSAARLNGAAILSIPTQYGGRGLTGKGIRIGIWDANVGDHVDYGNRVHREEFEASISQSGSHGMHTTGTIVGSGMLDERARGIAPKAEIWTYNFSRQSNGLLVEQEMLALWQKENISLTNNSYGMRMGNLCNAVKQFTYNAVGNSNNDILSYFIPTLTHVFAAGNDQGACGKPYSHATNYAKNMISVAALDRFGAMSSFSSFGPLLDGRLTPIISAQGVAVYSTVNNQHYEPLDGTSMACPVVTGHLALITERYKQLYGGALPYNFFLKALIANTARDAGNPGPDYKFGFGILDAPAALTALENHWFRVVAFERHEKEQTVKITVPEGVKELRAMLCWSDPVVRKEYAFGECPLVNDLDLTVTQKNKRYFPYTLDANRPDANAVANKKNKLDNIEQVAIKNPAAGDYLIKVSGNIRQGATQPYAIVWYFDYETPALMSPMPNDIYSPGETVYLRTENLNAPLRVELSTDNGVTYTGLGSYNLCDAFELPTTLSPTDKARIRVIDANGKQLTLKGNFTIMPQVENLVLNETSCAPQAWTLKWNPAQGVAKYEILRADLEQEDYVKIGETQSTEFVLPQEAVRAERNIYAVRALNEHGLAGHRSIGVLAHEAMPLVLTEKNLPYLQSFQHWPMTDATLQCGSNLTYGFVETPVNMGLPVGSQMLVWQGANNALIAQKLFEQKNNIGKINICELDLTSFPKGTSLEFLTYLIMPVPNNKNLQGALIRLLANGQELPDVQARKQITGADGERILAWDLSPFAGAKVSLTLETALAMKQDVAVLLYYQILPKGAKKDVGVLWANRPEIAAKPRMQVEEITFKLHNFSTNTLNNIPVSVLVDGKAVFAEMLNELPPFADKEFAFSYDFSSPTPHRFRVEVLTEVENDANPKNNIRVFEVYNIGDVLAMPEVAYEDNNGTLFPKYPYKTLTLEGTHTFVDGQGSLAPYKIGQKGVLRLLPKTPNHILQVTFNEYAFAKGDTLSVFTDEVPDNLLVDRSQATVRFTGSSTTPRVFISEATSGGLAFHFQGNNNTSADGWIGEVREIPIGNQWKLVSFNEVPSTEADLVNLQAVVKNHTMSPLYNVGLFVTQNEERKRYNIPHLAPNQNTTFTLPERINVKKELRLEVSAELAKDGDITDNKLEQIFSHDPFWNTGSINEHEELYVAEISSLGGERIRIRDARTVLYKTDKKIPIYTKSKNAFTFVLSNSPTSFYVPAKLRIWVDLNGDNNFQDNNELFEIPLQVGNKEYQTLIDLSSITDINAGERRMRVMLATDENYAKFKAGNTIPWGSVVDFTADLKEAINPYDREVAILDIEELKSGRHLSANTPIKVQLQNNGLLPLDQVQLSYKLDGNAPVVETIPCNLAPAGGKAVVTFNRTADLSNEGLHTVIVALTTKDANPTNNSATIAIFNIAPRTGVLHTLSFVGDSKEGILLPALGKEFANEMTIEGWWKLDKPQQCDFVKGSAIWVASIAGSQSYPDNTLAIQVGAMGGYVTEKPVLKPGEWQHIVLTLKREMSLVPTDKPTVYINGESVKLKQLGSGAFAFKDLQLNTGLSGENAMIRLWKTARTQAQIQTYAVRSVRDSQRHLPESCVGEYIFTEGHGTVSSFGDDRFAIISSKRAESANGGVWKPLNRLIDGVTVDGALLPAQYSSDSEASVIMPTAFTQFNEVNTRLHYGWPNTLLTLNETPINAEQKHNFSNAEHALTFKGKLPSLFGFQIEQTLKVTLVNDLSSSCDILKLTIPKSKNGGLTEDLTITDVSQTLILDNAGLAGEKASAVTLVVNELSPNAQLYNGKTKIELGTEFKADLKTPLLLCVVAQNGRNKKFYTLQLSTQQSIVVEKETIELQYTNIPTPLAATATSGLTPSYYSLNPDVATVDANGNLYTAGVGVTEIRVAQNGDGFYQPAQEKTILVRVTPAQLTVNMQRATMEQGGALPNFYFEYDGLLHPAAAYLFDAPYAVQLPDGSLWDDTKPPLEPGEYTVVPVGYTAPYEHANYIVTRTNGKLLVTYPVTTKSITVLVKDESNAPLPDAYVACGELVQKTSEEGKAVFHLSEGTYQIAVAKKGYTMLEDNVELKKRSLLREYQLFKQVYTLQYSAGANGQILGEKAQNVSAGKNGTTVVAVPASPQYRFKKWSDGNTEPARKESNVLKSATYSAEFEETTVTLHYDIAYGGEIVSGRATQTLKPGTNGEPITIRAKEGYIFIGWSDGLQTQSRSENNVVKDLTFKALFFKPYLLTWREDFENEDCLTNWTFTQLAKGEGKGWYREVKTKIPGVIDNRGNALFINPISDPDVPLYATGCWVATPWLSVVGKEPTTKVQLNYTSFCQKEMGADAMLEYQLDGAEWVLAEQIPSAQDSKRQFTLDPTTLAAHSFVRFRWVFKYDDYNAVNSYVSIDDIVVKFVTPPTNLHVLRYKAGSNGALMQEGVELKEQKLEFGITSGSMGPKITAIPNAGYEFVQWSDAKNTPMRQDNAPTNVVAQFRKKATPVHSITYTAAAHGTLEGKTYQQVEEGSTTSPVVAMPENGYRFVKWSDNVTDNPRTDKLSRTVTVEAMFEVQPKLFTISYKTDGDGELDGELLQTVESGKSTTPVLALPNDGYMFNKWSDNVTTPMRSENSVSENMNLVAYFIRIPTYSVTLTVKGGRGSISVFGYSEQMLNEVRKDSELQIIATPQNEDYELKSLIVGNENILETKKFIVTSDVNVIAEFSKKGTGVQDDNLSRNVKVAPNPFDNHLRIINGDFRGRYRLMNLQGLVMKSGNMDADETHVTTTSLPAGIYLLQITSEGGTSMTYRVVKQ